MKSLATERRKGRRILGLSRWALYHKSSLRELVDQIVSLIDNIEKLFPAPEAQSNLVREEVAAIGDQHYFELIEGVAEGVDDVLRNTVREMHTGHRYSNISIKGSGLVGDASSSYWMAAAKGASHRYDGVEVHVGGKGLLGNKYGGKDFWDD